MADFVDISKAGSRRNKRGAGDKPPKGKPKTDTPLLTPAQIEKSMGELLDGVAFVFVLRGDEHCATHVTDSKDRLTHAWRNLAEANPSVRRVLSMMLVTGKYTEVIIATIAFGIPIAQHHGLYPASWINPFSMTDENLMAMGNMNNTAATNDTTNPTDNVGTVQR